MGILAYAVLSASRQFLAPRVRSTATATAAVHRRFDLTLTAGCGVPLLFLWILALQVGQKYHVLCVLTDGIINDMVRL